RDGGERIFPRQLRVRLRRLARRDVGRQRIHPHVLRRFAVELAFPRGRGATTLRKGREALGPVEPLPALHFQGVPFDAAGARSRERERLAAQGLVAGVPALVRATYL